MPINITAGEAEAAAVVWLSAMDQPSVDGLNTFVISQAVHREGIKVAAVRAGGGRVVWRVSEFPRPAEVGADAAKVGLAAGRGAAGARRRADGP